MNPTVIVIPSDWVIELDTTRFDSQRIKEVCLRLVNQGRQFAVLTGKIYAEPVKP